METCTEYEHNEKPHYPPLSNVNNTSIYPPRFFQPWLLCTSIYSRKATSIKAHSIGITHRGRTGHWNSIDHAICRLLSINPRHYEYRRLIELLMLLGSNKLNIDEQSHRNLVCQLFIYFSLSKVP